jgi:hypothetical protein
MLDLGDEPMSEVVDDIPGMRATQLRNAQDVHRTACICL